MQDLNSKLEGSAIISSDPLEPLLKSFVEENISQHQNTDIEHQLSLYNEWEQARQDRLNKEVSEQQLKARKQAIVDRLMEIQAKDEKLRYFEQLEKIELGISERPDIKPIEDIKEEEIFVAAPGERGRGKN